MTAKEGGQTWSRKERLSALAEFLPIFSDPSFEFGQWRGGEKDGVIDMPWVERSAEADRFCKTVYQYGFGLDFDWGTWRQTPEALALRDDPDVLAKATDDQLAKLLTAIIRGDRFCEGEILGAFKSGLLTGIVRRARVLHDNLVHAG